MGLSTKQVSSDRSHDWNQALLQSNPLEQQPKGPKPPQLRRQQQPQLQTEDMKCPRCGSTNTKFCYYNNYNKLQPRHLCKACKRHWTKGGTLRDVPVGGGRRNKRLKTSNVTATSSTTSHSHSSTTAANVPTYTTRSPSPVTDIGSLRQPPNLFLDDQKDMSDLSGQVSSIQHDQISSFNGKGLLNNSCSFMEYSTLSTSKNEDLQFSFSNISPFDVNLCSLSTTSQFPDPYNFSEKFGSLVDSSTSATLPARSIIASQPWQFPFTSRVMDMPSYWNWADMDTLASSADLNILWDDKETKP